jgi:adenylate cyclase
MGEYYENLSTLVARRKGLTMGRAGDSVMCVWAGSKSDSIGLSPAGNETTPERAADVRSRENACQAALEIRDAIDRFNDRHATPLRTRIGLHLGNVAIGGVGGEYHVVGDVPNTASRIEALNKALGTTILASAPVVGGEVGLYVRPVGRFILPGRPGELSIVEILGRSDSIDPTTRERCTRFAEALALFETGDLAKAGVRFQAVAAQFPSDGPTRYYQRLCSGDPSVAVPADGRPVIRIESK